MNYCNSCGNEITDNSKYCSNCGKSLEIPLTVTTNPKVEGNKTKNNKIINYKYLFIGFIIVISIYVGLRVTGYDINLNIEITTRIGKYEDTFDSFKKFASDNKLREPQNPAPNVYYANGKYYSFNDKTKTFN